MTDGRADRPRRIDVTTTTLFRLVGVAALVWAWYHLWQYFLIFVAAIFLAVSLDPVVRWLDRRGLKRPFASPILVLSIALVVAGFLYLSGSQLREQFGLMQQRLTESWETVKSQLPDPVISLLPGAGSQPQGSPGSGGAGEAQGGGGSSLAYRIGRAFLSGLTSILIALVLTVYLLIDGRRTYEWFVAFAPPGRRARVHRTADAARAAIFGYVRGTVITSVLAAIITFAVLTALQVPAALLLAVLAGILNFIPVIGIALSLLPAFLLALTVSPAVALGVAAFYAVYNAVEGYYIQPKVFGHAMQLSGLAVLAAFTVGAELGGVIGALIALPVAAMYPAVERLWLRDKVGAEAVADHQRIEKTEEH